MSTASLPAFATFADDLLAALGRALGSLAADPGTDLTRQADHLVFLCVDIANLIADLRRDLEDMLGDGVPSHLFVARYGDRVAHLESRLTEQYRARALVADLPPGLGRVQTALGRMIEETEALRNLYAEAMAAATATTFFRFLGAGASRQGKPWYPAGGSSGRVPR